MFVLRIFSNVLYASENVPAQFGETAVTLRETSSCT